MQPPPHYAQYKALAPDRKRDRTSNPSGVRVPCIERNAVAAARALDANIYATYSDGNHSVSFDRVVEVMKQTGHDLPSLYKETATGGLAKELGNFIRK